MTIITDKNNVPIKDIPVEPDPPSFYEPIFLNDTKDNLNAALLTLPDRHQRILSLRFGLKDGKEHTLEAIGKILDIPREYARMLEAHALRMLRHPTRLRILLAS